MMLVALATYNEIENLPTLVPEIRAQLPDADVLVVDDNSPDGTGRWCDEFAREHPWFSVLHRPGKLGLGSATWAAMQAAIDRGYGVVVTLDSDWSHPPAALPTLVDATMHADVVIGSRYCPGGRIEGWPWTRRVVSRVMNWASRAALRLPVRDSSGSCRAYRVERLQQIDFTQLSASGYAYLEEIVWHLARTGARFAEVPIAFTDRRGGASKVHAGEAIGKARMLGRLAWRRLTERRG
ncbi:MAG TPA: polyprenol monophosphomannose synthase [Lacipirellulaceae bacterium]|nr:polyprenol monophosphomannose synthase [Lacipirellulaceae bacterium]HMP07538.1 polyprenol monophosphomannose synthase [Lacipirellulaceae bacterium]